MSRPFKSLILSADQRTELEALVSARSTPQALAQRARVALLFGGSTHPAEVAAEVGASLRTVLEWRRRFEKGGVEGLYDRPRSGRPTTLLREKVDEILQATVESIPHEGTHWSTRLMAKHAGVGRQHVTRVWRAAGLKPHRLKTFKISRDPHFVEKLRDVVGLYLDPPENAIVLSVDEKTQIQALDRTQPMLQLRPGQIERRTHDYKRNGTRSLYAALNVVTGHVIGQVTGRHRAKEFLEFLKKIDKQTPQELELHAILDKGSTHKTPAVNAWVAKHPRFHLHFTPTSASWLNAVEQWFGKLEQRSLYRGVFNSVEALTEDLYRHIDAHNEHSAKPFKWTKTADTILASVDRARALPEVESLRARTS